MHSKQRVVLLGHPSLFAHFGILQYAFLCTFGPARLVINSAQPCRLAGGGDGGDGDGGDGGGDDSGGYGAWEM